MKETMKTMGMILKVIGSIIKSTIVVVICTNILFIAYKGNQPMQVPQAPEGMSYFEFMADRVDAAKTVQPSQCGWGMLLSLATLGPIYSFVYTEVGLRPAGVPARGTAADADIPKGVADAQWSEVPGIWWNTVERLSWTMLGKPAVFGCQLR